MFALKGKTHRHFYFWLIKSILKKMHQVIMKKQLHKLQNKEQQKGCF